MARRVEFVTSRPKTILNQGQRADPWFWARYSAYPCKICQHRCLFWYLRELRRRIDEDPQDFAYVLQVKEKAPDLLRRALSCVPMSQAGISDVSWEWLDEWVDSSA